MNRLVLTILDVQTNHGKFLVANFIYANIIIISNISDGNDMSATVKY